jgi:hypothetical protein
VKQLRLRQSSHQRNADRHLTGLPKALSDSRALFAARVIFQIIVHHRTAHECTHEKSFGELQEGLPISPRVHFVLVERTRVTTSTPKRPAFPHAMVSFALPGDRRGIARPRGQAIALE